MSDINPYESQPQLPGFASMGTDTRGDLLDATATVPPTITPPEVAPLPETDTSFHKITPDSVGQEPGLGQYLLPPSPDEPRRKKTGIFLAIAAAGATLVGAAGLAFASNDGGRGAEQTAGTQDPFSPTTTPGEVTTTTLSAERLLAVGETPEEYVEELEELRNLYFQTGDEEYLNAMYEPVHADTMQNIRETVAELRSYASSIGDDNYTIVADMTIDEVISTSDAEDIVVVTYTQTRKGTSVTDWEEVTERFTERLTILKTDISNGKSQKRISSGELLSFEEF